MYTAQSEHSSCMPSVSATCSVVKNGKGKKRLVLDCLYANALVRYERFACG